MEVDKVQKLQSLHNITFNYLVYCSSGWDTRLLIIMYLNSILTTVKCIVSSSDSVIPIVKKEIEIEIKNPSHYRLCRTASHVGAHMGWLYVNACRHHTCHVLEDLIPISSSSRVVQLLMCFFSVPIVNRPCRLI